jgi:hypothetical protein
VKRLGILRCSNCGELTEQHRHCIACNHPLPQLPVAWGKFAILFFLAALWILLTHFQKT